MSATATTAPASGAAVHDAGWQPAHGLYALSSLGPLRRLAMREGTLPGEGLRAADPLKKLQSIIGPNAARGRQ